MTRLEIPDLCAHLDRLKLLCDRLEKAQADDLRYRELVKQIRVETEAMHATICNVQPTQRPAVSARNA